MTKKRILLILGLLCSISSQAQWRLGLQAGYSRNSLSTETGYFYDRRYIARGGISVSIPVQYVFNNWFALQAEIAYVQKNYGYRRSGFYKPLHENMTNHYLSLPLFTRFSFGSPRIHGFLNTGLYTGTWIASHRKGVTFSLFSATDNQNPGNINDATKLYSYDEKYIFDSRRDRRFESGLLVGIGMEYKLSHSWAVTTEGRYSYSLTDTQKDYMIDLVPRYHNTWQFQLGLLYSF